MGSEMCIRDSHDIPHEENDDIGQFGEEKVDLRGDLLRKKAEADICLLYTSDAADDLLCVDLGGRRIIKKKNNDLNEQRLTYIITRPTILRTTNITHVKQRHTYTQKYRA